MIIKVLILLLLEPLLRQKKKKIVIFFLQRLNPSLAGTTSPTLVQPVVSDQNHNPS